MKIVLALLTILTLSRTLNAGLQWHYYGDYQSKSKVCSCYRDDSKPIDLDNECNQCVQNECAEHLATGTLFVPPAMGDCENLNGSPQGFILPIPGDNYNSQESSCSHYVSEALGADLPANCQSEPNTHPSMTGCYTCCNNYNISGQNNPNLGCN